MSFPARVLVVVQASAAAVAAPCDVVTMHRAARRLAGELLER
jgi:hypothetical protein